MLDFFSIFSKGGILLWCFKDSMLSAVEWEAFTPTINELIKSVLLQERAGKANYWEKPGGQIALKYKLDNEFELVFVLGYQKMLALAYLDKLLDEIQLRFRDMFLDCLKAGDVFSDFSGFGGEFPKILRMVEKESEIEKIASQKPRSFEESKKSEKSIASMIIKNKDGEGKKETKKEQKKTVTMKVEEVMELEASPEDDLDEEARMENLKKLSMGKKGGKNPKSPNPKSPKNSKKKSTTWDPVLYGGKINKDEAARLDRTVGKPSEGEVPDGEEVDIHFNQFLPNREVLGKSSVLEDVEYESEEEENMVSSGSKSSKGGGMFAMFSSLVGSKPLTREDLAPVLEKLRDNLVGKNVASEVATSLIESVSVKLEGSVVGTFQSLTRTVKDTLTASLMKLLTPKRRVDILRDVLDSRENGRPYVITFCGVNGVGKSTNLAKICFWLIENKFNVLIAACDTFRAGAVEQLRTHTRRLNSLHPEGKGDNRPMVQLYEKGYGKDAAGIAMEAISHAKDSGIDVVLVDTAGRMQDNEPLMRALAKLIAVNGPDLVLFVGEALVGNEAIDQLVKFNAALADHSAQEEPHTIDGIVLTKFDTIDDKVGSAISMTYISGQPIVFVGTGQTYTDLKSLNAKAVVSALMK